MVCAAWVLAYDAAVEERAACAHLKRRFEAAGFRIKENQTFTLGNNSRLNVVNGSIGSLGTGWFGSAAPVTTPVMRRAPSGTSTRAPQGGRSRPSGTRYVNRSSPGTGTATETRRLAEFGDFTIVRFCDFRGSTARSNIALRH